MTANINAYYVVEYYWDETPVITYQNLTKRAALQRVAEIADWFFKSVPPTAHPKISHNETRTSWEVRFGALHQNGKCFRIVKDV